jgi:transposase
MNILAIDLGKFNSMFCFFDSSHQSAEFLQAATSRSYFLSVLKNRPVDLVVMEACGPSGWVKDLCEELQIPTLVCSTNEEAWRWKNVKRKTDRDDALKLARLAAMNELKPTHVPSQAMREYRTLVKYRKTIVRRINQLKNSIRSLFANRGIEISRGARTWHTGRKFLYEQRKPLAECTMTELWRGQLDIELAQLETLEAQLETAETRLAEIAKDDPRVQRLQRIPGVGPRSSRRSMIRIDSRRPHRSQLTPASFRANINREKPIVAAGLPNAVRSSFARCWSRTLGACCATTLGRAPRTSGSAVDRRRGARKREWPWPANYSSSPGPCFATRPSGTRTR